MTIGRDIIAQAFPGQPRMQAAFEDLVANAEDLLGRLETAATALAALQGDNSSIIDILAGKQARSDMLTALSLVGPDPGVLEQVSPGIVSIRQVDTADTASLMTRALADTRYLGGAHGAVSAAKWTTPRSITITGDGSWTVSVDGSANASAALTIPTVTSGAKGLAPASGGGTTNFLRADGTWAAPAGPTGAALTKTDDTNVTLALGGTPASALLAGVSITVGWTGTLAVGRGGTGIASYAVGDIIYASAATTLSKLADVATGNVLISGGVTTAPAWGKVGLTTHVSGVLPTANGGTNTDVGAAWTAFTPTITAGAGAFTTVSVVTARYMQLGKTVFFRISILITTNGTANSFFTVTAPVATPSITANAFQSISCTTTFAVGIAGRAVIANNSTTITVTKYDGTYLGQDNLLVHLTGCYEAA